MSFFKKVFASVGVGAAEVDTQLDQDVLKPGNEITGKVVIKGGSVEQNIDSIYLSLNTTYIREVDDNKVEETGVIGRFKLTEPFMISPDEVKEIPFAFNLPLSTPVSIGQSHVWVQTGLDIKNAVDPSDRDYIHVEPHPLMQAFFTALDNLGFKLHSVENEVAPKMLGRDLSFVQEFEFIPYSGPFRGKLDELEVVFLPITEDEFDVMLEVDRRANGLGGLLSEMLDVDETKLRIHLTSENVDHLQNDLESLIARYS
ncbi:sporulation protein [Bacillus solimangrovi]|uniref:Sporulation protein SpoOM n=1 Tax=Bacillus solimangrovi TaxID=1305675 RepID=A0A1E5LF80_9BACI|nr:sporulation protein [Bacillus solimangrovi]OEH92723.1 sporulation protein SpoOM [Bacillus solimangrovi]